MAAPPLRQIALLYGATIAVNAGLPFVGVALERAGLTERAIAELLFTVPLSALVVAPLWGTLADRTGRGTAVFTGLSVAAAITGVALVAAPGATLLGASLVAFALFRTAQSPLLDTLALTWLAERGGDEGWGRVRVWGSVAFAVLVLAGGLLGEHLERGGLLLPAAATVLTAALALTLPRTPIPHSTTGLRDGLVVLLRHPTLGPVTAAAVLHGVALGSFHHWYALLVASHGLPDRITGLGLFVGVAVEIALLATGPWWLRHLGPRRLLLLGLASGVPRWAWTGLATGPVGLVGAQALHGLTFGAYWLGAVTLVGRQAPPGLAARAQATLGAATFGLGPALALLAAREVVPAFGLSTGFVGLAVVSGLATVVALVGLGRGGPTEDGTVAG